MVSCLPKAFRAGLLRVGQQHQHGLVEGQHNDLLADDAAVPLLPCEPLRVVGGVPLPDTGGGEGDGAVGTESAVVIAVDSAVVYKYINVRFAPVTVQIGKRNRESVKIQSVGNRAQGGGGYRRT